MRPVCDVCGQALSRQGWRGPSALFACTNMSCPDFGRRTYTVYENRVKSQKPDRKENGQ